MALSAAKLAKILGVQPGKIALRVQRGDFKDTVTVQPNGRCVFDDRALDLAKKLGIGRTESALKQKRLAGHIVEMPSDEEGESEGRTNINEFEGMNLIEAKTKKEAYNAELARLDYETKKGILIPAKEVEKGAFKSFRDARDGILNIPSKISPEIASMDDPYAIQRMLEACLREVLEDLSEALEKLFVIKEEEQVENE